MQRSTRVRPESRSSQCKFLHVLPLAFCITNAAFAQSWTPPVPIAGQDFSVIQLDASIVALPQEQALAAWNQQSAGAECAWRAADGTWSTPKKLSGNSSSVLDTKGAVGADGTAVVAWIDIIPDRYGRTALMAAVRAPGAADFAPGEELTPNDRTLSGTQVAVDALGNIVVVALHSDGSVLRAEVIERPAGGTWSAPFDVSDPGSHAMLPRLAMNAWGRGAVVWQSTNSAFTPVEVHASLRDPTGHWSAPIVVSENTPNTWNPQVGVDARGRVTVAWNRDSRIEVARQSRSFFAFDPPEQLSNPGTQNDWPVLAVNDFGEVVVAWQQYLSARGIHAVKSARWLERDTRWQFTTLSDTHGAGAEDAGPPTAAASADGSLFLVTWQDVTTFDVRTSQLAPAHEMSQSTLLRPEWSAPTTLGTSGLWNDPIPVAAGPGGSAQVLFAAPVKRYVTQLHATTYVPK